MPNSLRVATSSASQKENVPLTSSAPLPIAPPIDSNLPSSDPVSELMTVLYEFSSEERHLQLAAAVNAFLGLPECPYAFCYPGESPTHDNTCPVCRQPCKCVHLSPLICSESNAGCRPY